MSTLDPTINLLVEDAGNASQSFGYGRALGQIYAFLYFSREPKSLADMQESLGISKGSASTNVRQLEQWGAVRKVWVKGDRRDYYAASDWFGRILKNAILDAAGKKMSLYSALLAEIEVDAADLEGDDADFIRGRISALREFEQKTGTIMKNPLVEMLLK